MSETDLASPEDSNKSPLSPNTSPTTACETIHEMSVAIQALEDYGLRVDDAPRMPADAVEQVLITDPWSCETCGRSKVPVCPATGRPHRRRLVRIAQDVLRLVGRRVGKSYARPARLAERMDGKVRVRTERHMAVNPQLLLLAFYFAAPNEAGSAGDAPSFVTECARHLLDLLRQVQQYGRRVPSAMDEGYAKALLRSFHSAWKEYLKYANGEVTARDGVEERVSADELFNGTRGALLAAAREAVRDPANTDLKAFVALLYQRVRRLANVEQLAAVQEELERIEQMSSPEHSPQLVHPEAATASAFSADGVARSIPAGTTAPLESGGPSSTPTEPATSPPVAAVGASPAAVLPSSVADETPRIGHANPLLIPSDLNTSGSEAEGLPPAAAARALTSIDGKPQLGPELPPDWYVDEHGRSRPRPGFEERRKKEKYLQLEFRARKAYEAVMNVEPAKTEAETTKEAVVAAVGEARLAEVARQLNQAKPRYDMIPPLLRAVEESLIDALPRRFRPQLEQEFRDVMDWNLIARRSAQGQAALSGVLRFVVHKVLQYGAPEREAALRTEMERVAGDLDSLQPDLGTAVANAFRFLFASVKTLRADVAKYSLLLVSNQLRTNAREYIRSFVDTCLPPPSAWSSSLAFLQSFINAEPVRAWLTTPAATSLVLLSEDERRVRGALIYGVAQLLRSGKHTPANRWDQLPAEIFYFEKSYIFTAANTVQECTLLLLLEGTVSAILASKRCTHAQIGATLKALHGHILELLSQDIKLNALKLAVTDFLDNRLEKLAGQTPDSPAGVASVLTEGERNVVGGTIDKMTNTESALYVSFETKVVDFMTRVMAQAPSPPPLGLVTETATRQANVLSKLLAFNGEVYRPAYQAMLPLLRVEP